MSIVRQLVHGLRNLLRREHADEDIADEVEDFVAETKADLEARGLTAEEATRAARLALGSRTALREEVYDRSLARTSFTLLILATPGSMALVLGLVGIYAMVSYSVSQQTREIGIGWPWEHQLRASPLPLSEAA